MRASLTILLLVICIAALLCGAAKSIPVTAEDITARCAFTVTTNPEKLEKLYDGSRDTAWTAGESDGQYVQIELPKGRAASGIYIMWNCVPEAWALTESAELPLWREAGPGDKREFINCYLPLEKDTKFIRIESESFGWTMSIAEIKVFGPGTLPLDVQVWDSPPERADLMVLAAHPDDEFIYFGGVIPYYAGQLKKHTAVVYMTSRPLIRKTEALDGLWATGVREYPVFLPLENKYSSDLQEAEEIWGGLDNVVETLVREFRRFKPDVVVTHDLDGEYGHGAHKLTALAAQKAVEAAGKAGEYEKSEDTYGLWQVKKCYLHLYGKNKLKMDWNAKLSTFGGMTALDMAKAGYDLHVSQHFRERPVIDTGEYDNSAFGLYYSSVGADSVGGDMFENVPPPVSPTPSPSAAPSAPGKTQPQAQPVAAQSAAPQAPNAKERGMEALIAVVVMMFAAAGLWVVANRKTLDSAKHAKK